MLGMNVYTDKRWDRVRRIEVSEIGPKSNTLVIANKESIDTDITFLIFNSIGRHVTPMSHLDQA